MSLSQAIKFLKSSGLSAEQVHDIVSAIILDFTGTIQTEAEIFLHYSHYLYEEVGDDNGKET